MRRSPAPLLWIWIDLWLLPCWLGPKAATTAALRAFRAVDILNWAFNEIDANADADEPSNVLHREGTRSGKDDAGLTADTVNKRRPASNGSDVRELYFDQRLDHFRTRDPRTFSQRYFYSARYVHQPQQHNYNNNSTAQLDESDAAPVLALLCVGGEGPALDASVLINSRHCTGDMLEFAKLHSKEYSIHLFALEHRYYGKSYPTFASENSRESTLSSNSPVSNRNLAYLSSRQAIADIGRFITHQSHAVPSPLSTSASVVTWITFGGSYPGMLAAWARLKLPHLISMAVSNSAPVQQVLDMAVYKAHEAKVLANPEVGGSNECLQVVQRGHEELVTAVRHPDQHTRIAELFQLCDVKQLRHRKNVQMWLGDGVINLHTQENNPVCQSPACGIKQICEALLHETNENNATHTPALAAVAAVQIQACVDIRWDETVRFIADPVRGQRGGLRSWLWQTCTEVGYYQTCETNSTCPYAQGYHLLDQDLEICRKAFGIRNPLQQVASNVQETLETYGGWKLQATHVLSVNGEIDPWSELALQKSSNTADRPVYHVPGASHHFWTNPVRPTDSKEVQEARAIIFDTLLMWLKGRSKAETVVAEKR